MIRRIKLFLVLGVLIVAVAFNLAANDQVIMNNLASAAAVGGQIDKPSDEELKSMLTTEQYRVTQKDATERPFKNKYWDNNAEGIYVDLVSGETLFSSTDKYKSGTGWPSFVKPIDMDNIVERVDNGLLSKRTEVRSKKGDSHLGHVFPDGPEVNPDGSPATGQRYCMNSAALRFVPKDQMEAEGYGEYMRLFE